MSNFLLMDPSFYNALTGKGEETGKGEKEVGGSPLGDSNKKLRETNHPYFFLHVRGKGGNIPNGLVIEPIKFQKSGTTGVAPL